MANRVSNNPQLVLEAKEHAHGAGTYIHNGKLYLFTIERVNQDGSRTLLHTDSERKQKIGRSLSRLLEYNEKTAQQANKPSLTSAGIDSFEISSKISAASPITFEAGGQKQALPTADLAQLRENNSIHFNFVKDLQKSVRSSSYKSNFLDHLSETDIQERKERLEKHSNDYEDYNRLATDLRKPNYADLEEVQKEPSSFWLKPETLSALIHHKANLKPNETSLPTIEISRRSPDHYKHLSQCAEVIQQHVQNNEDLTGMSIPFYEYGKDKTPEAAYGVYIDVKNQKIYLYDPSRSNSEQKKPINKFLTLLKDKLDYKVEYKSNHSHASYAPWEPVRSFKHRMKACEKRTRKETLALLHLPKTYHQSRYLLMFFDKMLENDSKDKSYKEFLNKKITKAEVEEYSERHSENLMASYHAHYNKLLNALPTS